MEVIENVNKIVSKLLIGASVESFGILNQIRFIEFRNQYYDIDVIIDSELELFPDINIPALTVEQRDLLILNELNLKQIKKVECTAFADIIFTFVDDTVLKISGSPQDETVDEPWQLTNKRKIGDKDYVSIVALTKNGYAVWGSLEELEKEKSK